MFRLTYEYDIVKQNYLRSFVVFAREKRALGECRPLPKQIWMTFTIWWGLHCLEMFC